MSAQQVAVARNGMRDALMERDASTVADNYADVSAVWTHAGALIGSARAVETSMRSTLESGTFAKISLEADRRAYAGIVFESGTYAYTFSTQLHGEMRFAGRFVALWKREGTRWKIAFESANPGDA